jgi:hypothetical protein
VQGLCHAETVCFRGRCDASRRYCVTVCVTCWRAPSPAQVVHHVVWVRQAVLGLASLTNRLRLDVADHGKPSHERPDAEPSDDYELRQCQSHAREHSRDGALRVSPNR